MGSPQTSRAAGVEKNEPAVTAAALTRWLHHRRQQPVDLQQAAWAHAAAGGSGALLCAPTGTGKTLAALGAAVIQATAPTAPPAPTRGLRVLWLTPLKATAADCTAALAEATAGLGLPWAVQSRTGDTSSAVKARQRTRLPELLVTTPESLCLLLSQPAQADRFASLAAVVVDEWHALLGSKRGTQVELALARLRRLHREQGVHKDAALPVWGLSATIGDLPAAAGALGVTDVLKSAQRKALQVRTVFPKDLERFPWAGHIGTRVVAEVVAAIGEVDSALVFTNTRALAELWFQALLQAKPEWAGEIGLHHGSLGPDVRGFVEAGLKDRTMRVVVCTSSLDLGVDFPAVDLVLQVGSPKMAARLVQRAGRAGHRPGAISRVLCVPTHALELVDIAAARQSVEEGAIEAACALDKPLDVLAQHLVTLACADGFDDKTLAEVRTTAAYQTLTDDEWRWVVAFLCEGGALSAYDGFRRVRRDDDAYRIAGKDLATRHRTSIGTIVADASMEVRYANGARLGSVEEGFIARLRPGARFVFAGRVVELLQVRDLEAVVRRAPTRKAREVVPRWTGGRMALSSTLAASVRARLEEARRGHFVNEEMQAAAGMLLTQAKRSALPAPNELLVEVLPPGPGTKRNEVEWHTFLYPFEGRLVHEGLGALLAVRFARLQPVTLTVAANDYGLVLTATTQADVAAALPGLLSVENLVEDILRSLDESVLARVRFREVARVAGLVFAGTPWQRKTQKQLETSTSLLFDVFVRHDKDNLLLQQARREALEAQLEIRRLEQTLLRLQRCRLLVRPLAAPTPFAFPLLVDTLRDKVSSEDLATRIGRLLAAAEDAEPS
jgi:ATP-dependent helicase Lhr and Lhr-like helicase